MNPEELDDIVEETLLVESANWVRGHYDFCIIHSDNDLDEVIEFRDSFCKKYNLEGILESDPELMKINFSFDRLAEMVKRSTKILMYISMNFIGDNMCNLKKNELLSRHLRDPQNCSNIIPVYTVDIDLGVLDLPFGLAGMSGFKVYLESDEKRIRNTFNANVVKAKLNRKKLEDAEWQRRLNAERIKLRSKMLTEQTDTCRTFSSRLDHQLHSRICQSEEQMFNENDITADGSHHVDRAGGDLCRVKPDLTKSAENILNIPETCFQTTVQHVEQCQIGPVYNISVGENAHLVLYSNHKLVTSIQNAKQIVSHSSGQYVNDTKF